MWQGLDTPSPYLQLSGSIFKGQHQDLLGTELLFTDSKGHCAHLPLRGVFTYLHQMITTIVARGHHYRMWQ